jgi:hypothetical protein
LEVLHKILSWEGFLGMIVANEFFISLQVLLIDKSISIDTFTLVHPKSSQIVWFFDGLKFGLQKTLEDIGQMTNIEFIVEVDGSLSKVSLYFTLEIEGCLDHTGNAILDGALELAEVLVHEGTEDCE